MTSTRMTLATHDQRGLVRVFHPAEVKKHQSAYASGMPGGMDTIQYRYIGPVGASEDLPGHFSGFSEPFSVFANSSTVAVRFDDGREITRKFNFSTSETEAYFGPNGKEYRGIVEAIHDSIG